MLDEVTQYLTDQYFSRGKYAVQVDTKVTELPGNQVDVKVNIKEGGAPRSARSTSSATPSSRKRTSSTRSSCKTPNWLSWYKQDDRYSRESLQGDLEKVRTYYMDRGYANFQIESTQVAIAPEKDDIFITINVNEGEVYKVSDDQARRHHGRAGGASCAGCCWSTPARSSRARPSPARRS